MTFLLDRNRPMPTETKTISTENTTQASFDLINHIYDFASKNPSPNLHIFRIILFISVLEVLGGLSGTIKSDSVPPTADHCCSVSLNLCCADAKPWR